MKSLYIIAALAAFNFTAAQKTIALQKFKEVTFGSDSRVTMVRSHENKLVVQDSDDNDIEVKNEGKMLLISGDSEYTLYYTDAIANIIVGSDSSVQGDDEIKTNEFKIIAAADAVVQLNLNVQKLYTIAESDAVVTLTGKATNHDAVLSADALLNSVNLVTKNTVIKLSSDAAATITANDLVTAAVGSDGSLKIHGNPKSLVQSTGDDASVVVVK